MLMLACNIIFYRIGYLVIFSIPTFRTRSPQRDIQTDKRRSEAVKSALNDVINSLKVEIEGLQTRVDRSLKQAVHIMDSSGEYHEREPEDEQLIVEFEKQAETAQNRLKTLKNQLDVYENMLDKLLTL